MRPRQRSVEAQRSPQQKGEPWRGITRPAASAARRRPGTPRRGQRPCPGARRCASGSAPVEAVWNEAAHPKGTSCVRGSEPGCRTTVAGAMAFDITAGQGHPGEIRDRRLPRPNAAQGIRSKGEPRAGQRFVTVCRPLLAKPEDAVNRSGDCGQDSGYVSSPRSAMDVISRAP